MDALRPQYLDLRRRQASIVPGAHCPRPNSLANGLFQSKERGRKGILGTDNGLLRAETEVVGYENSVVGRHVTPNELSLLRQEGAQFFVEGLRIPDVDQIRSHHFRKGAVRIGPDRYAELIPEPRQMAYA